MIKKKVMIIDMVVMDNENVNEENSKSLETQLFLDMLMMVLQTGRERREEEWAKLFCAAGFSDYKIIPILGVRSLIECLFEVLLLCIESSWEVLWDLYAWCFADFGVYPPG
ncbi:hypothetical protein V6N11_055321 [Hibiscus sabdariffa]|uniref:Uncharacterized protein n=2 Tax=Hibiscus sabdariffa TaxID=183260 RepID=A0ABR2A0T3_9ROSI